jgi:murein DD-endopeptidase / murein LD-carboxypeptidase
MRILFFVSVAVGILSGTTISAKAQTSINLERLSKKFQPSFIENIEVKRDAVPVTQVTSIVYKSPAAKPVVKIEATSPTEFGTTIETCTPIQFKYAQLMDIEVEEVTSFELFNFIDEWWAVRYRYGGTTKRGVDCSSYTGQLISNVFGYTLPRTAREQYRVTQRVNRAELAEGDLVFFNTTGGVSHVGIYVGNGYFTHSSCHSGVTISKLDDAYYSRKYIGGGRINVAPVASEATASAE